MSVGFITADKIKIPPVTDADADLLYSLEDRLGSGADTQWYKARILAATFNDEQSIAKPRLPLPPGGVRTPLDRFDRLFPEGVEGLSDGFKTAAIADLLQTYELVIAAKPLLDDLAKKHGGADRLLEIARADVKPSTGEKVDLHDQAGIVRVGLNHLAHAIVNNSLYGEAGKDDPLKFQSSLAAHEGNAASIFHAAHLVKAFVERVAPTPAARASFSYDR